VDPPLRRRSPLTEHDVIRELSEELVALQRPIRVLDAVAWDDDVAAGFLAAGATRQPVVDANYYRQRRPLRFDPDELRTAFRRLEGSVTARLGDAPVATLLHGRLREYLRVIDMLEARGTPDFSTIAAELYGSPDDALHEGGPTLASLGELMSGAIASIDAGAWEPPEEHPYTAPEAVEILRERLAPTFGDNTIRVILDDGIVADAAAGASYIKLREDATFSARDLRQLEVHEGWVHVGTSLNGQRQETCTFLSKGTPSTTVTQEGLAVFTEVTTLSSTPERLRKVTRRMTAIGMACDGATFLDVYRWFGEQGMDQSAAWASSVRVFRGSTPEGGPFTKDLVYSRGFIEVYDVIRLAVRRGLLERLPLLFAGKMTVEELGILAHLAEQGLVTPPAHLPPHFADVSALASWMAYSNLLNRIDLSVMEEQLDAALT
jgi:uncharacterized protein (TIGR02421 family)